jgi:hypothetical protein
MKSMQVYLVLLVSLVYLVVSDSNVDQTILGIFHLQAILDPTFDQKDQIDQID